MSYLLDTHAFLWWLAGEGLEDEARDTIADPSVLVVVSAVSVMEIAIKKRLGKLDAPDGVADAITQCRFLPLAISPRHGEHLGTLPDHHRDPFDRTLIAQAQLESLTVMTRDPAFGAYDVRTVPC